MWPVTIKRHWQFIQAEGWALSKSRCGAVPHSIGRGTGICLFEHIFRFSSSTPRGGAPRPQNQDAHWETCVMMPDAWVRRGSPPRAHPNSWGMHPWLMLTSLPKWEKMYSAPPHGHKWQIMTRGLLTSTSQDELSLSFAGCGVIFCREPWGKGKRCSDTWKGTISAFGGTRKEETPSFQSQLACQCISEQFGNHDVWWGRIERCLLVRFTKSRTIEQLVV